MNTKKVSVIVPVYNPGRALAGCLDSLAAQDYPDLEVLLVDDGSTDGSAEICREFAGRDARFRFEQAAHGGVARARNLALGRATGEYLIFVDSDDTVSVDFVSSLANAMETGCELAVCNYVEVDWQTEEQRPRDYCMGEVSAKQFMLAMAKRPIHNYYGVLWNRIFRRDIVEKQGIRFDPGVPYGEDTAFFLKYMHYVKRVNTIPCLGYFYVYGRAQAKWAQEKTSRTRIDQMAFVCTRYQAFWRDMGWYWMYRPLIQSYPARVYFGELDRVAPEDSAYLYEKLIAQQGLTKADYRLFAAVRRVKRALKGRKDS